MGFLTDWLQSIGIVLAQSGPYLLVGFVIAGLLKIFLPERLVYKHLGKDNLRSVSIASLFGVPIPLCSCSVLPSAIALKRAGASKGATTSFLISTPETGVDSIGVTWALMDPLMTIARPFAALVSAILSGSMVNVLVRRGWDDTPKAEQKAEQQAAESCCADDHGHDHDHEPTRGSGPIGALRAAVRYGFGPLMADLTPSFIVGFILSGLILVILPEGFIGETLPGGFLTMLAMLVIGIPIYICATATTPVAAALVARGLDPGAALVLMLAGPATNIATMVVVKNFLGKRVLGVYLASIAVTALLLGWLVSLAYTATGIDAGAVAAAVETEELGPVSLASAAVLLGLMGYHAFALKLPAKAALSLRRMGAKIGIDPTSRLSRAVLVIALGLAWLSTSLSVVRVGDIGFEMRFGRVVEVQREAGPVLHAPAPFTRLEHVEAELVRGTEFGFDSRTADAAPFAEPFGRDLNGEAEVITGDENLLSILWTVQWRVGDATDYRFGVGDPEELLRAFAESSLRRVCGRRTSDSLLLADREELQRAVGARLQSELDSISAGLEIVSVHMRDLHAPAQVHEAYRDVASAEEDKQRQVRQAERYEKELTAQARARAFSIEEKAQADRLAQIGRAEGEARAFIDIYEAQLSAPELLRHRLRREAAARALSAARLVIVLAAGVDVIPLSRGRSQDGATGGIDGGPAPWEDRDE